VIVDALREARRRKSDGSAPCTHSCFIIVLSRTASNDAKMRLDCFARGARMVTASQAHVGVALRRIYTILTAADSGCPSYECPLCFQAHLSAEALSVRVPSTLIPHPGSRIPHPSSLNPAAAEGSLSVCAPCAKAEAGMGGACTGTGARGHVPRRGVESTGAVPGVRGKL
jgi:hypothetical protein